MRFSVATWKGPTREWVGDRGPDTSYCAFKWLAWGAVQGRTKLTTVGVNRPTYRKLLQRG